jgi:hypothetical protein
LITPEATLTDDDVAIGAGGTLLALSEAHRGLRVRALVLSDAGTEREGEATEALAAFCPAPISHSPCWSCRTGWHQSTGYESRTISVSSADRVSRRWCSDPIVATHIRITGCLPNCCRQSSAIT